MKVFLVKEHLFSLCLCFLDWDARERGCIESLGRHIHLYPVQMGKSSRHRRIRSVFARGDFVF